MFYLLVVPDLTPNVISLGCFADSKRNRLLRIKLGSFRSSFNLSYPFATVVKCTHLARDTDYDFFAVQNYGDCYTDVNIAANCNQYGEAPQEKCLGGVGASFTNFVYQLMPAVNSRNACDSNTCRNEEKCFIRFNDPEKYYRSRSA